MLSMWNMSALILAVTVFLLRLVHANNFCNEGKSPRAILPDCTDSCLENGILDGTCAYNLRDICLLSGGVNSFFLMFSDCLLNACESNDDQNKFLFAFQDECASAGRIFAPAKGYPPALQQYIEKMSSHLSSSTVSRITFTGGATDISSAVPSSATKSSSSLKTTTTTIATPTSDSSDNVQITSISKDTVPPSTPTQKMSTSTSATTKSSHPHSISTPTKAALSAPSTDAAPLSTATITGVSIGGAAFLALVLGLVLLCLRRRKRIAKQATPGMWEPGRGVASTGHETSGASRNPKLPQIAVGEGRMEEGEKWSEVGTPGVVGGGGAALDEHANTSYTPSGAPPAMYMTASPAPSPGPRSPLRSHPPSKGNGLFNDTAPSRYYAPYRPSPVPSPGPSPLLATPILEEGGGVEAYAAYHQQPEFLGPVTRYIEPVGVGHSNPISPLTGPSCVSSTANGQANAPMSPISALTGSPTTPYSPGPASAPAQTQTQHPDPNPNIPSINTAPQTTADPDELHIPHNMSTSTLPATFPALKSNNTSNNLETIPGYAELDGEPQMRRASASGLHMTPARPSVAAALSMGAGNGNVRASAKF